MDAELSSYRTIHDCTDGGSQTDYCTAVTSEMTRHVLRLEAPIVVVVVVPLANWTESCYGVVFYPATDRIGR